MCLFRRKKRIRAEIQAEKEKISKIEDEIHFVPKPLIDYFLFKVKYKNSTKGSTQFEFINGKKWWIDDNSYRVADMKQKEETNYIFLDITKYKHVLK